MLTRSRQGDVEAANRYCHQHGRHGHFEKDTHEVVSALINAPAEFNVTHWTVGFLDGRVGNFEEVFSRYQGLAEQDLLSMYAKAPGPKMAQASAILFAEYLRVKILQDMAFKPDIGGVMDAYVRSAKGMLGEEAAKAQIRDSIMATQNALVSYVAEKGNSLPLNRAAAMLQVLADDVDSGVSDLWLKPMTDIRSVSRYSFRHGDFTVHTPLFGQK